jgi:hypothetical protein
MEIEIPNQKLIKDRLKNVFYSCYDAYCDLSSKKINPWEALLIAYNLGKLRANKDKDHLTVKLAREICPPHCQPNGEIIVKTP